MRQLGAIAVPSASPKLTHGAELPTNHPVASLVTESIPARGRLQGGFRCTKVPGSYADESTLRPGEGRADRKRKRGKAGTGHATLLSKQGSAHAIGGYTETCQKAHRATSLNCWRSGGRASWTRRGPP